MLVNHIIGLWDIIARSFWPAEAYYGKFSIFSVTGLSNTNLLKLYTCINVIGVKENDVNMNWVFLSMNKWTFHPVPPHQQKRDKETCNINLPVITLWFTFHPWQTAASAVFAYRNTFLNVFSLSPSLPFFWRAFVFFVCRSLLQIGEIGEVILLSKTDGQREDDHLPFTGHTQRTQRLTTVHHTHTHTLWSEEK